MKEDLATLRTFSASVFEKAETGEEIDKAKEINDILTSIETKYDDLKAKCKEYARSASFKDDNVQDTPKVEPQKEQMTFEERLAKFNSENNK